METFPHFTQTKLHESLDISFYSLYFCEMCKQYERNAMRITISNWYKRNFLSPLCMNAECRALFCATSQPCHFYANSNIISLIIALSNIYFYAFCDA